MLLTKRDSFSDFIDQIFNDVFNHSDNLHLYRLSEQNFSVDYNKDTKEHSIALLVPGFSKEDLSIESDSDKIIIKGEIKDNKKGLINENKIHYEKSVRNLDKDTIEAKLENGILEIKYKEKENKDLNKIEIKGS
jgi:HSP20 family molecular chaperone IbpA